MPRIYLIVSASDNIDTRTALDAIRECISFCNVYVKDRGIDSLNLILLRDVASYIIELMQIFGVIPRTKPTGFPISSDNTAANVSVENHFALNFLNFLLISIYFCFFLVGRYSFSLLDSICRIQTRSPSRGS